MMGVRLEAARENVESHHFNLRSVCAWAAGAWTGKPALLRRPAFDANTNNPASRREIAYSENLKRSCRFDTWRARLACRIATSSWR
jgi:hypothetical protein